MTETEPPLKITVATVTYNAAALIDATIASVERQDYPWVEHIIVDGNSRDDTLAHVHRYQERNSVASVRHEIVCISEPDNGLYDAMNKALELATGSYIVFLNAGDRLHDAATLSRVARTAQSREPLPAVVYGHTDLVDAEGRFVRHRRLAPPPRLTWRSFARGMLVCHQAFYARTDLARACRYDLRYRFSADFDWCVRLLKEAARRRLPVCGLGAVAADYLSEGLTTQNHRASLRERFAIMTHHYGLVPTVLRHAWFVVRAVVKK